MQKLPLLNRATAHALFQASQGEALPKREGAKVATFEQGSRKGSLLGSPRAKRFLRFGLGVVGSSPPPLLPTTPPLVTAAVCRKRAAKAAPPCAIDRGVWDLGPAKGSGSADAKVAIFEQGSRVGSLLGPPCATRFLRL